MSTHRFTLDQIEHFLALADELNFTRAAQRCNIAQPPFSRSIQRLEAAVGVPLVERHPRMTALTEPGRVFAQATRPLMADLRGAVDLARAAQGGSERIRVGLFEYVFALLGTDVMGEFAEHHPTLRVEPVDWAPVNLAGSLARGVVDLQFTLQPEPLRLSPRSDLRALKVFSEPLGALMGRAHPLARRRRVTLAELARARLILLERIRAPELYQATLQAFAQEALHAHAEIEVGLLQTMISAVRACGGVGLVPQSASEVAPDDLTVIALDRHPPLRVHLTLVWAASRETEAMRRFVDWVRARRPSIRPSRARPAPTPPP